MKKKSVLRKIFLLLIITALFSPGVPHTENFAAMREAMVEKQIKARGVTDPRVLNAMLATPRHRFVKHGSEAAAYNDHPLPIGEGQTISQPYIVALMSEMMECAGTERVLEIGTGSGYQAAVLSRVCGEVFTIEIKKKLFERTSALLKKEGYKNINTRFGDGYFGWEEKAPFDAIMITAAASHIPPPLVKQLKEGGRLIMPLGERLFQTLTIITKKGGELDIRHVISVRFVPMTGKAQE